jgi:uncharacterized protein Yka (UPF0111/DUF47 family)
MHALYELKDMLCKELEEYGEKGELSAGALDIVDKLTHTIKNLDKIIDNYDDYSGRMSYRGRSYGTDGMYRYARRSDRYSRSADMIDRLRDLMKDAPDDHTRNEIQRLVTKMEQM